MSAPGSNSRNLKPKPVTLTMTNIFKFTSFMSPFLITFFIIISSILNNTLVKGLLFIAGITILSFITYLLKNTIQSEQNPNANPFCNILPAPFTTTGNNGTIYDTPSLSSSIIGFTTAYLIFPMKMNNQLNPALTVFLIAMLVVNGMVEYQDSCTSTGGSIVGALVGIIFGMLWYGLVAVSGHKDLAYFSKSISNNVTCGKPSRQNFRCNIVPGGEGAKDTVLNAAAITEAATQAQTSS